jgi:RNA polymerase sigma-70 factor (ECF subfamily)
MNTRRERKLIRALRAREEDAFTELVLTYQHKVFNVVARILTDRAEAEDVAQEVFITVFKHIDQFRGDAQFSTWLYRIAMNHARNRIKFLSRRSQRQHQDIEETPEGAVLDNPLGSAPQRPDKQAQAQQLEVIIQQGLCELAEEHREIIVLRDIENLSYQEISEITGLAEGTVKSRLFRARVALKEYVCARYEFEPQERP